MFHDPSLERTTDGKGFIREQAWSNVIEHIRTIREPRQQIPTFQQVCDLLMKPENLHVKLNVSLNSVEYELDQILSPFCRSTLNLTTILNDYFA